MDLRGRLLKLSYGLSHHYLGSWTVGAWIAIAGVAYALLGVLIQAERWPAIVAVGGAITLLTVTLLAWGRVKRYQHFRPEEEPASAPSDVGPIRGSDAVKVRATGKFAVEGKEKVFADLDAIYHTFERREHTIMAHVPLTKLMSVAHSRKEDVGMWYVFFRPEQIQQVVWGDLTFGAQSRPALRIAYRDEEGNEHLSLAFASEDDRVRVAADLLYDL